MPKLVPGLWPSGMTLNVEAKAPTSHGKGNKGTSTGEITLTSTDQSDNRKH